MVALLRGINVGGSRKVSMADLRAVAIASGFTQVETYINSGNLVFDSGNKVAPKVGIHLEGAIQKHFGFPVDVVVRTQKEWRAYPSQNPFSKAGKDRPHLLMIGLSKQPLDANTAERLRERATKNERVEVVGDAILVDFGDGVGRSKLTPAWFEKSAGSPVTIRNWKTVLKLQDMLSREG